MLRTRSDLLSKSSATQSLQKRDIILDNYIHPANLSISLNPTLSDQSSKHDTSTSEQSSLHKRVPLQRALLSCPPQALFWRSECEPYYSAQAYKIYCHNFQGGLYYPLIESNACTPDEICVDVFPPGHPYEMARCVKKERYLRIAQVMLARSARARSRAEKEQATASESSRAA